MPVNDTEEIVMQGQAQEKRRLNLDKDELVREMKEVDKLLDNISHNRLLQRNWERLKIIAQKKMHKDIEKAKQEQKDK